MTSLLTSAARPKQRDINRDGDGDSGNEPIDERQRQRSPFDLRVGGENANQIFGLHGFVCVPLVRAASEASPRCKATRTAPRVISKASAASAIAKPVPPAPLSATPKAFDIPL